MDHGAEASDLTGLGRSLAALAAQNVFIGTSSWKYPGWLGQVYMRDRYIFRGKFSEARFERNCLAEYAETFRTVCVDAAYYKFPGERFLAGLFGAVPDDFRFAFKVTDEITIRKFTNLPRFGDRAGKPNENFLNADLFASAFLHPLEPHRAQVGVLMFEFSHFWPADFARGRDFVEVLDGFLARLPKGWPYAVEIRNRAFLHADYFEALRRHGVAHVFNSWADMPAVGEQIEIPGSRTADFIAARFLLKPGRDYEEAVAKFSPYDCVHEVNEAGRRAGAGLIRGALREKRGGAFIYVNNRFEGNAIQTIRAMLGHALAG